MNRILEPIYFLFGACSVLAVLGLPILAAYIVISCLLNLMGAI